MRPAIQFEQLYKRFDHPVTGLDCGEQCRRFNPRGAPFCCDICTAVPVAYPEEWAYLKSSTNLWTLYRGNECGGTMASAEELEALRAEVPRGMLLLACLGADRCQRPYRSLTCRQFPFFPYFTADFRFIGLAGEWPYARVCWVLSHLGEVTQAYREEFTRTFDEFFSLWPQEMQGYADHSEELREEAMKMRQRIPLLHRDGTFRLISPRSGRMERVGAEKLPRFGFYQE